MASRSKRIPNYEILKILAMLIIVCKHANQWGFHYRESVSFGTDNLLSSLMYPLFSVFGGSVCFVLISSWFLSKSDKLRYDRIIKLWFQIVFYSFGVALLFACLGKYPLGDTIQYLTPLYHNTYWFMTKYVGFLLIVPFLTKATTVLSKKEFQLLLGAMALLCMSIYKNIPYGNIFLDGKAHQSLILWTFVFAIAAYIRRFGLPVFIENNKGKLLLGMILLQWFGGIMINILFKTPIIAGAFSSGSNALTLVTTILLFLWVKDLALPDNWFIHFLVRIAPYSVGVYLVHEHPSVRRFLWGDVFNMTDAFKSAYYVPYLVGVCLAIYCVGTAVEWLRSNLYTYLHIDDLIDKTVKKGKI